MKNKNLKLWHYTPASQLPAIIESGHIKLPADIYENKKPVVWFSSNPNWENSVTKYGRIEDKDILLLTQASMIETCGLGRIEVKHTKGIIPWQELKETNGVHPTINYFSELARILFDGNPTEWFASYTQCDTKDWIAIEIWKDELWQPFEYKDGNKDLFELVGCKNLQIIDM